MSFQEANFIHILVRRVPLTYEVVCDCAHPLVGHDDPDDDEVPARGHGGHQHEEQRPQDLPPQRQVVRVLCNVEGKNTLK